MPTISLQYQRGSADARTLQAEFDEILIEVAGDPDAPEAVIVREGSQGADPAATIIIIDLVTHVGARVFDELILPKLKNRLADDAVGRPVDKDEQEECRRPE